MVTELLSILIIALVIQQAVEAIKKAIKIKKGYSLFKIINIKMLISIIISITLCVTSEIGLLVLLGIKALPILDYILTGVVGDESNIYKVFDAFGISDIGGEFTID